jgi:hypothetical protein
MLHATKLNKLMVLKMVFQWFYKVLTATLLLIN